MEKATDHSPKTDYGMNHHSFPLTEEHRPMIFENKLIKKIFGLKTAQQQRDKERHSVRSANDVYFPRSAVTVDESWTRKVARIRQITNAYKCVRKLIGHIHTDGRVSKLVIKQYVGAVFWR